MTAVPGSLRRIGGAVSPRRSERTTADVVLLLGLLSMLVFSTVAFELFGLGEARNADRSVVVLQRVAVYGTLVVGLLAGVRVLGALVAAPTVAFFSYLAWSVVAAALADDSLQELDRTIMFASFALLVAMVTVLFGWERVVRISVAFGICYVGAGIVGHVAGWIPPVEAGVREAAFLPFDRARGLATHANTFGRASAYLALAGVAVVMSNRRDSSAIAATRLGLVGGTTGLIGLVLSQSRFTAAGFAIGLAVLLGRSSVRLRKLLAVVILVVAVTGVGVFASGNESALSRSGDTSELGSLFGRTAAWGEAASVGREHLVTGVGIEGLRAHFATWESSGYSDWNPQNAHNTVLQAVASHGLPGALLYAMAMIIGIAHAWRSDLVGVAAFFVMFVVHGIAEAILVGNPSLPLLLVIAGFVALGAQHEAALDEIDATHTANAGG